MYYEMGGNGASRPARICSKARESGVWPLAHQRELVSKRVRDSLPGNNEVDEQIGPRPASRAALLSLADRELIATYVSAANDCIYCQTVHGAIAAHHMGGDEQIVAQVKHDFRTAPISGKLKALLKIGRAHV